MCGADDGTIRNSSSQRAEHGRCAVTWASRNPGQSLLGPFLRAQSCSVLLTDTAPVLSPLSKKMRLRLRDV